MSARPATVLVVAGEASGDRHAASLVRQLLELAPETNVLALGGSALRAAGATILHEMGELSVVGFTEVVTRLPALRRVLRSLGRRLRSGEIDVLVPVDFPDFNFRLAHAAGRAGVPVFYFIAPQVWAWRTRRVRTMARWCSGIAVLFPFEAEIFSRAGVPPIHMSHPLLEESTKPSERDVRLSLDVEAGAPLVALLPGSRSGELRRHLPVMREAGARLKRTHGASLAIGRAESVDPDAVLGDGVPVVDPPARDLMRTSDVVVVASGTATLEVALAGTPMVVIYRVSPLTWQIARRLVRVEHVAMANLLAGERLVPELLQGAASAEGIAREAGELLTDDRRRERILAGYARVRTALGTGAPVRAVAERVLALASDGART